MGSREHRMDLEDIEFPKGFRMTPLRRRLLAKVGIALLKGTGEETIELRRGRYSASSLVSGGVRGATRKDAACLRDMVKAGFVRAEPTSAPWGWHSQLIFPPGLAQAAKRLAGPQVVLDLQKEALIDPVLLEHNAMSDRRHTAWRNMEDSTYRDPGALLTEEGMKQAVERLKEYAEAEAAEKRLQERVTEARARAGALQPPSLEEARAWLAVRELRKAQEAGYAHQVLPA